MTKYPFIEHMKMDDEASGQALAQPVYWNTYYLWTDEIKVRTSRARSITTSARNTTSSCDDAVDSSVKSADLFVAVLKDGCCEALHLACHPRPP
jgi:hypothetical protein